MRVFNKILHDECRAVLNLCRKSNKLLLCLWVYFISPYVRVLIKIKIIIFFLAVLKLPLILYYKKIDKTKLLDNYCHLVLNALTEKKNLSEKITSFVLNYLIILVFGVSLKSIKISIEIFKILKLLKISPKIAKSSARVLLQQELLLRKDSIKLPETCRFMLFSFSVQITIY